jgi:hypothetical protein
MGSSDPDFDARCGGDRPSPWIGYWRVRRYGGDVPPAPTFYDATRQSWDVIKGREDGLHVARHPILEIKGDAAEGDVLVLKDEGAAERRPKRGARRSMASGSVSRPEPARTRAPSAWPTESRPIPASLFLRGKSPRDTLRDLPERKIVRRSCVAHPQASKQRFVKPGMALHGGWIGVDPLL